VNTSKSFRALGPSTGTPTQDPPAVGNFEKSSLPGERLLAGLHAGDESAIAEIYSEYGRTVFGFLLRTLGDRGEAEDVQQKVFTEVWTRGASYDPQRASLLTWIMQIARSRAIDHLRRQRPEPVENVEDFSTESAAEDGFTDELNEQWQFAHLLQRLPKEESELLRARFYDGKSQSQIADETGMAIGTVKMRMVHGLQRLREMLEEENAMA
jgi:RNA polymerase sigma-70 factor (ECF subfamily)